jgi:hypothetical protein
MIIDNAKCRENILSFIIRTGAACDRKITGNSFVSSNLNVDISILDSIKL